MSFLMKDVSKSYTSRDGVLVRALEGLSLEACRGGMTCIVGPTGSGKSTVLRLLAGLEGPDSGFLSVDGRAPGELKGKIGYLTQRHTLFPWMNVVDNIALPLELRKAPDRGGKTVAIMRAMGLEGADDLYPYELSGGMQQRAAIGRLLASEAPYWLLDEPFSHLDERTRHQLQGLLEKTAADTRLTVLFVTHSIDEAVFLADTIYVLSAGPGHVVDYFEPGLPRPRNRLSPDYGRCMERIRQGIESVLG